MSEPTSPTDDERESTSGSAQSPNPSPNPSPDPPTSLGPVSAGAMTGFGVVGLIVGWAMHRVGEYFWGHAPLVTWSQVLAPYVASVVLGVIAWITWGQVQGRRSRPATSLDFQSAFNRLILARASALIGCLIAGGYLGYAMSWLWIQGDYAVSPAIRSAITGVGGIIMTLTALALQRACRVRSEDDST